MSVVRCAGEDEGMQRNQASLAEWRRNRQPQSFILEHELDSRGASEGGGGQGGAGRGRSASLWEWRRSSPPLFGHVHIAKTAGTTLNGNMSMHFERVCGNKGYSFDAFPANLRRTLGEETAYSDEEIYSIGFAGCDWISQETLWTFWGQFETWDQPVELHVPCRDTIDHLLSMCNHGQIRRKFNCAAGNLFEETEKCVIGLDRDIMRFSNELKSIPNIHLKCFDWRASFNGNYFDYIGNFLQGKKKTGQYFFWATNQARNFEHECLQNETQKVQQQVRDYLRRKYDYFDFCDQCMGSEDDIFHAWKGSSGPEEDGGRAQSHQNSDFR